MAAHGAWFAGLVLGDHGKSQARISGVQESEVQEVSAVVAHAGGEPVTVRIVPNQS